MRGLPPVSSVKSMLGSRWERLAIERLSALSSLRTVADHELFDPDPNAISLRAQPGDASLRPP